MKTILFILLLISADSFAQVGTAWTNYYGATGVIEYGNDAALDAAGNIYVTGGGDGDIVLVKYNPAGVLQWARTHTGTASSGDTGEKIKIDAAGNIYIGGILENTGSNDDIALLKYNSAGVQQWVKTIKGSNPSGTDKFGSINLDAAGNIYITGYVSDTLNDLNAITAKFNPAGNEQWRSIYESSPSNSYQDEGISITVDAAGNVYVAGLTFLSISSSSDMLTLKYNPQGGLEWARTAGSTSLDEANDIAVSDSGFIYVTGKIYYGTGLRDDAVTIKYDAEGTELWRVNYNRSTGSYDRAEFIMLDDSSNVYIAGNAGDYMLIKYNAGGEQKWAQFYDGPHSYTDYMEGMAMDKEGNIYLTGEVQDTSATDGFYYPHCATVKINNAGALEWSRVAELYTNGRGIAVDNAGDVYVTGWGRTDSQDLMLIKYSPSVGIEPISNEIPEHFELKQNYPNPFNPVTNFEFSIPGRQPSIVNLTVYDISGKEIAVLYNEVLQGGTYRYSFDGSGLNSGVYFYRLKAGNSTETKKMVLLK